MCRHLASVDSELLDRLEQSDCYPGSPRDVELRQTHLSVICLAGDRVYKLKKPVQFPFVDFSSVERRRYFCEEEVRLNRRLCPDLYLGVETLFRTAGGSWTFREEDGSEIADYAVHMRRLPEGNLLHRRLEENDVSEEQLREVAHIMAGFHRQGEVSDDVRRAGSPEEQQKAVEQNFEELEALENRGELGVNEDLLRAIQHRTLRSLERWVPVLEERADRDRVVDGHGDLHARNICLTDPPAVFDCIDFRPEFRCGDVVAENAFLVMDLIHRGAPGLAQIYLDAYLEESGDEEERRLMPFFVSFRALVRAKVAALAANEPEIPDEERRQARESVRRYLQLAAGALLNEDRLLLVACGLPATGKSTLCRELALRTGWPVCASDRIRKELAGVSHAETLPEEFYRPEFSARTYAEVIRQSCEALSRGCAVADANFPRASSRAEADEAARNQGTEAVILWTDCDESVVAERLRGRSEDSASVSDADWEVYRKLKSTFEPPSEEEGRHLVRVDGSETPETNVDRVLTDLLRLREGDSA